MRHWLHLFLALTMLLASPATASGGFASTHVCPQHAAHHQKDATTDKAAPLSALDTQGQISTCCQTSVFAAQAPMIFASPLFMAGVAYASITHSLRPYAALPVSPPPKTRL